MKDALPSKPHVNEMAIVNLDNSFGRGTHWVCYKKQGSIVKYFDSFGNLPPPVELHRYFGRGVRILYNYPRFQKTNSVICGHLCLLFLQS
jgi:hypothetical protein